MLKTRKLATAPSQPTEEVMCAVSANLLMRGVMLNMVSEFVMTRWKVNSVRSKRELALNKG